LFDRSAEPTDGFFLGFRHVATGHFHPTPALARLTAVVSAFAVVGTMEITVPFPVAVAVARAGTRITGAIIAPE
jgi:hypothetical protein